VVVVVVVVAATAVVAAEPNQNEFHTSQEAHYASAKNQQRLIAYVTGHRERDIDP
jgi:hypothetical protein